MTLANARIQATLGGPAGYFFRRADCRCDHLLFADDTASLTVPVEVWRDGERELLTAPETAQIVNDCMFEAGALMNLRFGADKSKAVWLTTAGGRWGATDPQLCMNGQRVQPITKADDYLFGA